MQRNTNKETTKHPDSFERSINPLLVSAQVCGLLPVSGIFDGYLKFSWGNGIHVYGFLLFAVTLFFDTCYTIDNLKLSVRIDVMASTVFYTVCLLTTLFFLEIAKELPQISKNFQEVEAQMKDYGYPKRLGFKIKLFLYSFIFLATIEHGTLVIVNLKNAYLNSGEGGENFGYSFYGSHFPAITKRMSYSAMGTLLLFWVNTMCTFNWNYLDFFLIVMSMEVYTRFGLINEKLNKKDIEKKEPEFWNKVREDYNSLSLLTKNLDKKLAKVILTSFFSNMYHISLQLVRSLKMKGSSFQVTYFYCSLTYLISRLLLVLYFAAKINDESRKPYPILLSLENPCPEAIRLQHQVHTDDIALTGNKFFVINNRFVASIVGTLCTYQGVLLQYNSLQGDVYP